MTDKKVFCKDCANFKPGFDDCIIERETFNYVEGARKVMLERWPYQFNYDGECKDYRPKPLTKWEAFKIIMGWLR